MKNSKGHTGRTDNQAEDLISELARIVADDDQRSAIADSIRQRAEEKQVLPSDERSAGMAPIDVSPPETGEQRAPASPYPTETDARDPEGINLRDAHIAGSDAATRLLSTEPVTSSVSEEVPFEFDFEENIKLALQSADVNAPTVSDAVERSHVDNAREPEAKRQQAIPGVTPVAAPQDGREPELDAIAALIEQIEFSGSTDTQSASEVPAGQPVESDNNPARLDTGYADPFSELSLTEPPQASGQKPFVVPPVDHHPVSVPEHDRAPGSRNGQATGALEEIENLIADTKPPVVTDEHESYPVDAAGYAETSIAAALNSAPFAANEPQSEDGISSAAVTASDDYQYSSSMGETAFQSERRVRDTAVRGQGRFKTHSGNTWLLIATIAVIVGLTGAGGLFFWQYSRQNIEGDVPVVAAQNTEVKLVPETSSDKQVGDSAVFSALDGSGKDLENEQILFNDTPQTADVVKPRIIMPSGSGSGLTNRKVKTVTVLADGTIVSGEQTSAGAEQLPEDVRPNVPELVQTAVNKPTDEIRDILNSIVEDNSTGEAAPIAAGSRDASSEVQISENATIVPQTVRDVSVAPVPPARPAGLETARSLVNGGLAATSAAGANEPQPVGLLPGDDSGRSAPTDAVIRLGDRVSAPYYVQLASQRSEETAQTTAALLKRRYSQDLGTVTLDIDRVDLEGRGIYFRVRAPAQSLEEATRLCESIKSNGGDCFVTNSS